MSDRGLGRRYPRSHRAGGRGDRSIPRSAHLGPSAAPAPSDDAADAHEYPHGWLVECWRALHQLRRLLDREESIEEAIAEHVRLHHSADVVLTTDKLLAKLNDRNGE